MGLEYFLARLALHDTHDMKETAASLGIALGNAVLRSIESGAVALPFVIVYQHQLFDVPLASAPALAALLLGTEFFYYWHHRASHRIRWMWATHAVHHSPSKLNYTAAVRLGWTGTISGNFLFFLPLVWLGFHPLAVIGMLGVNLGYQFFIHTQFAPHLGPLEWVLNTPRHHQVHHASNVSCLDRNYGGILIIFDRIFGTFAERPEHEALRYGLVKPLGGYNPFRIAFGEWFRIARDVRQARTWKERLHAMFGTP
jgi:sterol desaturase/sphingolipid hydroxylase (fatty acid hydroxylase superfamily)